MVIWNLDCVLEKNLLNTKLTDRKAVQKMCRHLGYSRCTTYAPCASESIGVQYSFKVAKKMRGMPNDPNSKPDT